MRFFRAAIGYLSAAFSASGKLPPEIATERTGDGGLFLIATEDRLDPNNPEQSRRGTASTDVRREIRVLPWSETP
jgi:hypothetical protein